MRSILISVALLVPSLALAADPPKPDLERAEKTEHAEARQGTDEEDDVVKSQSVDAFNELEDAQPGPPAKLEVRTAAAWGYVPAEGQTPNGSVEFLYTPRGAFGRNMQLLAAIEGEHDDIDNTFGPNLGWQQRWFTDGGRGSAVPSIGTLTEFFTPMPGVRNKSAFWPGATTGSHLKETLVVAKYVGPGTAYLNGFVQRQISNTQICDSGLATRGQKLAKGVDGCDYWAPWTFGFRVGYQWVVLDDKLSFIADYMHETNEFTTQKATAALPDPEQHLATDVLELSVQWRPTDHWTLGPGVQLGVNGRAETPTYEAGLVVLYE